MSPSHHPGDHTLVDYAAGALDEGLALVVATHLLVCPDCRRMVGVLEEVGGALLDDLPPVPMERDALVDVMARTDAEPSPARRTATVDAGDLFALVARYDHGAWRRLGPGLLQQPVVIPGLRDTRVFLLKGAGGVRLPMHGHTGVELSCVLSGGFSHAGGHFGPGALDEADDQVMHRPVVDSGADCVTLVAMQGRLRLTGLLGKLLQPFVRL